MPQRNCLLIIAYLLTIESSHDILFRNRDEIVKKIGPRVTNAQQALFVADQIDSWVAGSLESGDVVMPGYVIHQILERLKTPRKTAGFCHPVLHRSGICP